MSEFLKPQSPLQHKDGAYVYPLTTVDQVILENNNRLNSLLENIIYADEDEVEVARIPLDADTLNGYTAEDFIKPKAGFIYPLAGSVIPEGFLLCDGAEYKRTDFPELFAAIGTIYGNGDGSTTFNVPNLQTRVPVGAGGEFALGATGGEAEHTLTVDEMPSHTHRAYARNWEAVMGAGTGLAGNYNNEINEEGWGIQPTGGSQPHNNMQPYTVVNYIIATGKDTGVSVSDIIMGAQAIPLGIEYGGTGATNAETVRENLGITPENIGAAPAIESDTYSGCYYRTVNGETEWLNPPMVQGTEYRTAERFKNKVVYSKSINFGTLPNASMKEVSSGLKNSYTVIDLRFLQYDTNAVSSVVDYSTGGCSCWLDTNKTKVVCSTTIDMSGTSGLVYLKYTK